jgi:thioredoxin-related protein
VSALALGLLLALAVTLVPAGAEGSSPAGGSGSPDPAAAGAPGIAWFEDFEQALEAASFEERLVFVDFHTSWCGWCRKMERETYRDPKVVLLSSSFVCVRVDAEKRADVARTYGARAFPTFAFLQPNGVALQTIRGYLPPERFAAVLEGYVDEKAAEFTLRQRLRDHPDLTAVRRDLALMLLRQGKPGEAAAHLDTLSASSDALEPLGRWAVRFDHARALLADGRSEPALKILRSLVEDVPDAPRRPEAVFLLAEASRACGKKKEARKWYEKLLQERPQGWLAERSRARLADLG